MSPSELDRLKKRIKDILATAPHSIWAEYESAQNIMCHFLAQLDNHRGMDVLVCLRDWVENEHKRLSKQE